MTDPPDLPPGPTVLAADTWLLSRGRTRVILPPGVPGREALCLNCSQPAAGEILTAVTLISYDHPPCICGEAVAATFWLHDKCADVKDVDLVRYAEALMSRPMHEMVVM